MPEKSFIIKIIEGVTIFVYFLTIRGRVERFVIKLNFMSGKKLFEIARYDSGLHTPHLDLLRPDGKKDRMIDLSILENSQAMNVAIEDFTNNWSQYVERWKKWKKERKE
jgi:hypothetical protein